MFIFKRSARIISICLERRSPARTHREFYFEHQEARILKTNKGMHRSCLEEDNKWCLSEPTIIISHRGTLGSMETAAVPTCMPAHVQAVVHAAWAVTWTTRSPLLAAPSCTSFGFFIFSWTARLI